MSVTGISNPLTASLANIGRPQTPAGRVEQGQTSYTRPVATPQAPAPLKPQAPMAGAPSALSVEAPAGTDPELWSVLTADERSFFAKASALGPLTYGRISAAAAQPAPPAARGGRLDVRA
jgi:hypothetical protein